MIYKVLIADSAERDATEMAKFILEKEKNPSLALNWITGLHQEIASLCELPHRFSIIPEANSLGIAYRSFQYQAHRVMYEIDDNSLTVTVHRVYHRSRKSLKQKNLRTSKKP